MVVINSSNKGDRMHIKSADDPCTENNLYASKLGPQIFMDLNLGPQFLSVQVIFGTWIIMDQNWGPKLYRLENFELTC